MPDLTTLLSKFLTSLYAGAWNSPAGSLALQVGGVTKLTISSTAVTSTVPGQFTALGVGVSPPAADGIQTAGDIRSGSHLYVTTTGGMFFSGRGGFYATADAKIKITNSAETGGVIINAATTGVATFRNYADTADAQVTAASVRGNAVTYANRPATAVQGMLVCLTDSSTAVYNATIAGGGANIVLAMYDGTNWVVK